jgi:hypothetical protein
VYEIVRLASQGILSGAAAFEKFDREIPSAEALAKSSCATPNNVLGNPGRMKQIPTSHLSQNFP